MHKISICSLFFGPRNDRYELNLYICRNFLPSRYIILTKAGIPRKVSELRDLTTHAETLR
jgi:hypothetical protein